MSILKYNPNKFIPKLAFCLHRGGLKQEEALELIEIVAKNYDTPFSPEKIKKSVDNAFRIERNLASEIREWVLSSNVPFESSSVVMELGLSSRVDKKNCSRILARLVEEGVLERGKRRGHFRPIDKSAEVIDWQNTEAGDALPLRWPLELEKRFEVMPGSVVIVAGESNSGKTSFLLNVARMNLDTLPTFYFSSSNETNARTLRKRLELFGEPLEVWKPMTALSRAGDYQDVIRPNALNLIDYLEVHQDFYEIGGMIAAIAERLKDGTVVIALQKNPGAAFGRGGAMTMDKATAYLSLHRGDLDKGEAHTLKLPKVKYPLVDYATKPIRFKLAGGSRFIRI